MPDMLILAAPVVVIALWCLLLLLAMLRKWRAACVVLIVSLVFNWWTEQIPLNLLHKLSSACKGEAQRFPKVKQEGAIRVLNYNVCGKEEYAPRHGQEFIDYIVGFDADILFLPENNFSRAPELDAVLKERYPYYMQQFEKGSDWVGEHTLYSRYPLSNPKIYKMDMDKMVSDHPEFDEDFTRQRGDHRFIYQADADIDGTTVTLVHVHLCSNLYDSAKADGNGRRQKAHNVYDHLLFGYTFRKEEVKMIYDSLSQCPNPLLIAGDFNDLSGSRVLRSIQDLRAYNVHARHRDRLTDAWWDKGFGLGFTFDDQHLLLRLDHILYSKEFDLQEVVVEDVDYSDHRPMIADFLFTPNK